MSDKVRLDLLLSAMNVKLTFSGTLSYNSKISGNLYTLGEGGNVQSLCMSNQANSILGSLINDGLSPRELSFRHVDLV